MNKVLHGILGGANKGLGEASKSCTRKEHESATNSIAKRGQGGDFVPFRLPLAGSRDSVPCGVWGNAPTVPRLTNPKEVTNKGAGSEASLPVTLRVRRRALKLLFPQDSVMNQKISAGAFGCIRGILLFGGMARHSSRTISTCICRSSAGITHSAKPPSTATSRITSTSMPSMSNTALLNARV